jgi:hypothetical protein
MRTLRFLILLAVCLATSGLSQTRPYCVPYRELRLGGVTFGDRIATVRRRLGSPQRVDSTWSEGDGAGYRVLVYHYGGLAISFGRGRVEAVEVSDSTAATASGVRVGQTLEEVGQRLRVDLRGLGSRRWDPPVCGESDVTITNFIVTFSSPRGPFDPPPAVLVVRRVVSIHIEEYWP